MLQQAVGTTLRSDSVQLCLVKKSVLLFCAVSPTFWVQNTIFEAAAKEIVYVAIRDSFNKKLLVL